MFNSRNLSSCKTGQQKETKNNVKVQRGKLIQISMFLLLCLAFLCVSSLHGNQNVKLQRSHCNYKTFSTRSCLIVNHNFVAKITNGNRRSNGIKLCQWNAGGGFLSTKQPELQNIVSGYKPHVLGITESSFKKIHDKEDVQIQDYNLYFAKTLDNPNLEISRSSVYVHKDLKVKVRHDLMINLAQSGSSWGSPDRREYFSVLRTESGSISTNQMTAHVGYQRNWIDGRVFLTNGRQLYQQGPKL